MSQIAGLAGLPMTVLRRADGRGAGLAELSSHSTRLIVAGTITVPHDAATTGSFRMELFTDAARRHAPATDDEPPVALVTQFTGPGRCVYDLIPWSPDLELDTLRELDRWAAGGNYAVPELAGLLYDRWLPLTSSLLTFSGPVYAMPIRDRRIDPEGTP